MSHKYNKPYKKVIHKKNKKNIDKIDDILLDKNHSQLGNSFFISLLEKIKIIKNY